MDVCFLAMLVGSIASQPSRYDKGVAPDSSMRFPLRPPLRHDVFVAAPRQPGAWSRRRTLPPFLALRSSLRSTRIFCNCASRRMVCSPSTGCVSASPVALFCGCSPSLPPDRLRPVRSPVARPLRWSARLPRQLDLLRIRPHACLALLRVTARRRLFSVTSPCAGCPCSVRFSSLLCSPSCCLMRAVPSAEGFVAGSRGPSASWLDLFRWRSPGVSCATPAGICLPSGSAVGSC